jgi:hypothetical protein
MSNVSGSNGGDPLRKLGLLAALSKLPMPEEFSKLTPELQDKLKKGTFNEDDLAKAEALLKQGVGDAERALPQPIQKMLDSAKAWVHGRTSDQDVNDLGTDYLTNLVQALQGGRPLPSLNPPTPPADPTKVPICPVLAALQLHGKVNVADFQAALKAKGFDPAALTVLGPIAEASGTPGDLPANFVNHTFDVDRLSLGLEKHPGDSMILSKGQFDPEKFANLEKFAETAPDGTKVMTKEAFSRFIVSNVQRDVEAARASGAPANELDAILRGGNASAVEYGALLASFGQVGKDGSQTLKVDDLRQFYSQHVFPKTWTDAAGKSNGNPTMLNIAAKSTELTALVNKGYVGAFGSELLNKIGNSTPAGLARESIRLALDALPDDDKPAAGMLLQSMGASSGCPYLNGGLALPTQAPLQELHGPNPPVVGDAGAPGVEEVKP